MFGGVPAGKCGIRRALAADADEGSTSTLGHRNLASAVTNPHFLTSRLFQFPGSSGEVLLDLLRIHPLRFVGHFLLDGVQGIEILIEGLILRFHCITSNGVWINNTCSYPPST